MSTAETGDHQQAATQGDRLTLRDTLKLIQQASGTKKVSGPPPGTRVRGNDEARRYIPTLSLDPRNVAAIEGYSEATAGYVQCAMDAFSLCYVGLKALSDAREQVGKDTTKTDANKVLIVAAEGEKLQDRMTRAMDGARTRLVDGIKSLDESLSRPMTTAADNTVSAEVRKFVRDLPDEKRVGFLEAALKKQDTKTLQALLGAQPFLSGITDEMQSHFTRAFHEMTQPAIAQRLAVMRKALALVESRAALVLTEIPKILGTDWPTIQKLRRSQSASEQALLLVNNVVT